MKTEYGPGPAGLIGSDAAEYNHIFDSRVFHSGRDAVGDVFLITLGIVGGDVGWNHDVGGICLLQGLGEGRSVGDIADKCLRTLRCERLQMRRVSADDANFLLLGKKIPGNYVARVAACSKNNVHK